MGRGRKGLTLVGDFQTAGACALLTFPPAAFAGCERGQLALVLGCQVLGGVNRTPLKP